MNKNNLETTERANKTYEGVDYSGNFRCVGGQVQYKEEVKRINTFYNLILEEIIG